MGYFEAPRLRLGSQQGTEPFGLGRILMRPLKVRYAPIASKFGVAEKFRDVPTADMPLLSA